MYFSICNDVDIRNHALNGKKSILIRILEPSYKVNGIPYKINNISDYKAVLELYIEDNSEKKENINVNNIFDFKKAQMLNDL